MLRSVLAWFGFGQIESNALGHEGMITDTAGSMATRTA